MTENSRQHGFSYVEVLVAVALMAIVAGPLGEALRTALATSRANIDDTAAYYQLLKVTEDTMASNYGTLSALATNPDVVVRTTTTDDGAPINIYVSRYDGDNADLDDDPFTGTDDGLLWIKVELDGTAQSFESLKAQ